MKIGTVRTFLKNPLHDPSRWVKVPAGKTLDRKGQPLQIKLKGKVEAFYK